MNAENRTPRGNQTKKDYRLMKLRQWWRHFKWQCGWRPEERSLREAYAWNAKNQEALDEIYGVEAQAETPDYKKTLEALMAATDVIFVRWPVLVNFPRESHARVLRPTARAARIEDRRAGKIIHMTPPEQAMCQVQIGANEYAVHKSLLTWNVAELRVELDHLRTTDLRNRYGNINTKRAARIADIEQMIANPANVRGYLPK